jgi:cobalt-zinc-cadmium efflux system membrane fusion protein
MIGVLALVASMFLFGAFGGRAENIKTSLVEQVQSESLELSEQQASGLKIELSVQREFQPLQSAVGLINFNENLLVQVFTQYSGKIIRANYNIGDEVKRGDVLFTLDSPDLLQAGSTLLSAAGVLQLQNRVLGRVRDLLKAGGSAQKDLDQAVSDQQTAEANYKAAKDAVRLFGKTDEDIDRLISERKMDSTLVVTSPISGRVVARTASPGLLVQSGTAPPPFIIADVSVMWMVANITESEVSAVKLGQTVEVTVPAYPGRRFVGRVSSVGLSIDSTTHRQTVRSDIGDPDHLLRAGMLADFAILVGQSTKSIAVRTSAVVREGDGSMTIWTTTDRKHFIKRQVEVGVQQQGWTQITQGLSEGESVVSEGAIFLSNKLLTSVNS